MLTRYQNTLSVTGPSGVDSFTSELSVSSTVAHLQSTFTAASAALWQQRARERVITWKE